MGSGNGKVQQCILEYLNDHQPDVTKWNWNCVREDLPIMHEEVLVLDKEKKHYKNLCYPLKL